jgi:hypothetical protein
MKRITIFIAVLVFTAGIALAHGNDQHVMGTVTAMTDNSITVQTTAKEPVTVYTMANTKYTKSGAVASMTDLKVGDRVVIHAEKMNDKVMANEVQLAPVKRRGITAAH